MLLLYRFIASTLYRFNIHPVPARQGSPATGLAEMVPTCSVSWQKSISVRVHQGSPASVEGEAQIAASLCQCSNGAGQAGVAVGHLGAAHHREASMPGARPTDLPSAASSSRNWKSAPCGWSCWGNTSWLTPMAWRGCWTRPTSSSVSSWSASRRCAARPRMPDVVAL